MSKRAYYLANIEDFLLAPIDAIIGELTRNHSQDLVHQQTGAWKAQIEILKYQFSNLTNSYICFELLIPRMGKRADAVLITNGIIFVFEFKVGSINYTSADLRQTQGYAWDLNYFHEASHNKLIIPILIATRAINKPFFISEKETSVTSTIITNGNNLSDIIKSCISTYPSQPVLDPIKWLESKYKPTPTIVEAAQALYNNHDVKEIARSGAENLEKTVERLNKIIYESQILKRKSICFVTGVPGAGKTLVGLNIATTHANVKDELHAVFLSGNGPLVDVLREALARDKVKRGGCTIGDARRETATFIQNIHHFRDDALNKNDPPPEKVVIFDEAQRAWNEQKTSDFMQRKRGQTNFGQSEPEFLIKVMDRHPEWCVIIALIGGGQEINNGEAGLNGWLLALNKSFSSWHIFYSEKLNQAEYAGNNIDVKLLNRPNFQSDDCLHLSTSMRSFRAERLAHFIHHLIHNDPEKAINECKQIMDRYSILITRDLTKAKAWIKKQIKGNDSSGLLASSGAKRLKATGIFVENKISPNNWFLNDFEDIRSCHFLEDSATEFVVQGLELDWCLIAWDADYRHNGNSFEHWLFKGSQWTKIKQEDNKRYLENAYRVLLTRARQGMIIYVPYGDNSDETRLQHYYDDTYSYLQRCGLVELI